VSVILINPSLGEPAAARICTPPLGLAYLSASLKKEGIDARVLDADALGLSVSETVDEVANSGARVAGVTAMTPTADSAYQLMSALREAVDFLVIGGAHASALGHEIFDDCPVELDAAVIGEAEETFPVFCESILSGRLPSPGEIPGVLLPGGHSESVVWPRVEDIDSLPLPDRSGLPGHLYRHPLFGNEMVTTLITSRGCPYRCVFCDKHVCGKKWRSRSVESVLYEIEGIALKNEVRSIIIYDDLFTLNRDRTMEICEGIIRRDLRIKWKCEGRVNRVDPEMLSAMKRAGCEMVAYGVETVHEKSLQFLKKDITPEQTREAFTMTRKAGIQTLGYFMLGIPGETIEDELETARFAVDLKADYAQFGVLSPFPGTDLYETARERGWIRQAKARGPAEIGSRRPLIMDGYWDLERIDRVTRDAHRIFYFRPGYVWGRLTKLKSPGALKAAFLQAAGLAGWWLKSSTTRDA